MKPFDLELAKAGHPVCRRDGKPARIICFDRISTAGYPIIALVPIEGTEYPMIYAADGRHNLDYQTPHNYDLMMVSEKHEGWINIKKVDNCVVPYVEGVFESESKAKETANIDSYYENYITTIKIEWEE